MAGRREFLTNFRNIYRFRSVTNSFIIEHDDPMQKPGRKYDYECKHVSLCGTFRPENIFQVIQFTTDDSTVIICDIVYAEDRETIARLFREYWEAIPTNQRRSSYRGTWLRFNRNSLHQMVFGNTGLVTSFQPRFNAYEIPIHVIKSTFENGQILMITDNTAHF